MKSRIILPLTLILLCALSCRQVKVYWLSPLSKRISIDINYKTAARYADARFSLSRTDSLILSIENCLSTGEPIPLKKLIKESYPDGRTAFGVDTLKALFGVPMLQLTLRDGPVRGRVIMNKFGNFIHRGKLYAMNLACFEELRWNLISRFDK